MLFEIRSNINKLFKTINLEGDDSWGALITSDQQTTGFINQSYFLSNYYIRLDTTKPKSLLRKC